MSKGGKGPAPRLDLAKKSIEDLTEYLVGEKDKPLTLDDEEDDKKLARRNSNLSPKSTPTPRNSGILSKVKEAQTLLLSNNKLKSIPSDTYKFEELRALYLDHNNFTEFPIPICQLPHLEKIHLEFNQITKVPADIRSLRRTLKKLYLHNNALTELAPEIGDLGLLQTLDLHDNNIQCLPPEIAGIVNLTELAIYHNPIISPPPFICNKGIIHLLKYLREIRESSMQVIPAEEFIWSRKINFTEAKSKLKRSPTVKVLTRTQSAIEEQKSSKAINAHLRKGSTIFREQVDDAVFISQSHLLYYLTDYHSHETCGRREYMEDRCISLPRLRQNKPENILDEVVNMFSKVGFFAVYDGHGGDKCADYLIEHMHKNICNSPAFVKGQFEEAIRAGFKMSDEAFLKKCREYGLIDGSTALVAMLIDDKLITAHAGDSRAVLCRDKKAIRLTEDHKPDRVDELARIEEIGGEVVYRGNCFRVMGDLAMSRSFGDLRLKEPKPYVICDPEIRIEELTPKDEFIILASDGLWDVFTDQRAVDLVRKCTSVEEASKKLVETALALGTMDNTTVIVIKLDWSIDFLTQDELEGKIEPGKTKKAESSPDLRKDEESEKKMQQVPSFRSSLENWGPETNSLKDVRHIFPQASSASAIKLKVLIPHIEATKLMKFDVETEIREIIRAIILKHRFEEPSDSFDAFKKGESGPDSDELLDPNQKLVTYGFPDMGQIEIRKKGTAPAQPHHDEPSASQFDELYSQEGKKSAHRATSIWTPVDANNNNNNSTDAPKAEVKIEWKRHEPTPNRSRGDSFRLASPRLDRRTPTSSPSHATNTVTFPDFALGNTNENSTDKQEHVPKITEQYSDTSTTTTTSTSQEVATVVKQETPVTEKETIPYKMPDPVVVSQNTVSTSNVDEIPPPPPQSDMFPPPPPDINMFPPPPPSVFVASELPSTLPPPVEVPVEALVSNQQQSESQNTVASDRNSNSSATTQTWQ